MAVEICAFYKKQGKTMYEALLELYEQYGFYLEGMKSLTLKGKAGAEQIANLLTAFRNTPPTEVGGYKVKVVEDYSTQERLQVASETTEPIDLPKSNVLKYFLEDGTWVCVRPSGTEPKVKFYIGTQADSMEASQDKLTAISESLMKRLMSF